MTRLTAIDVFSGAGGLSLGARRAGFDVRVAIELDSDAAATYKRNNPKVHLLQRDIRTVRGAEIMRLLPGNRLDLLMGCAPCQGFCSLTQKNAGSDPRNLLILEMSRLIEEMRPSAVLMENVPGLAARGRQLLRRFEAQLLETGYVTAWRNIQMADFGVPQKRRRLVLLAGLGFSIPFPLETHARRPAGSQLKPWKTVRDAIYGESAPVKLSRTGKGGPVSWNWHVVRDIRAVTKARLQATAPGRMRMELGEALLPDCHKRGYTGFRNVYMRMAWDSPAPTITAGCTTPAKGRFGHPDRRRTTISIREAAAIQTFPRSFRFETESIEAVCELIGNAVPPLFGKTISEQVHRTLVKHYGSMGRKAK